MIVLGYTGEVSLLYSNPNINKNRLVILSAGSGKTWERDEIEDLRN